MAVAVVTTENVARYYQMSLGDRVGERAGVENHSLRTTGWEENIKTGEFTGKPINFPHENVNNNIFKMYLLFYND